MQNKTFVINGVPQSIIVDPEATLGDVLRKQLLMTGTKVSCNDGHCGACSVLVVGGWMRSMCNWPLPKPNWAIFCWLPGKSKQRSVHEPAARHRR